MATPRTAENELDAYLDRIAQLRDVILQAHVRLRIPLADLIGHAARSIAADQYPSKNAPRPESREG